MTTSALKIVTKANHLRWRVQVAMEKTVERLRFREEFNAFKALCQKHNRRFSIDWEDRYLCLNDRTATTGFDRHYVYHCAWAARILAGLRPAYHVDISSHLYFGTLVSAFVPVRFYDYRPAEVELSNLTSEAADLCALPFEDQSISSLSCMHVVEHVGLGRYGDPMDPEGDLKAMAELARVLAVGGSLLFVVPIGQPRIMFNAHRIYSYRQIVDYFSDLSLEQFAMVPDKTSDGSLLIDPPESIADAQRYACGCFWFKRPKG